MVAEALQQALGRYEDLRVIGVVSRVQFAVEFAHEHRPDVVVLDFTLPDGETPEAVARFKAASPGSRIVVVSAVSDYNAVVRTLEAGADGFLLKDQPMSDLVDAVRTVHAGGRALAPQLVSTLVTRLSRSPAHTKHLSARETEVLGMLAAGQSTLELAANLGVSVHTVRNHVQSAIRRLGAHSKLEAVAIAQRQGLIGTNGARSTS